MGYNTDTTYTYINFMGHDFEVEIDYEVTDWGSKSIIDYNWGGDPGWGPEWDIETIILREDKEDMGPPFEATGKLFQILANNTKINEAILEGINDSN